MNEGRTCIDHGQSLVLFLPSFLAHVHNEMPKHFTDALVLQTTARVAINYGVLCFLSSPLQSYGQFAAF